MFPLDGAEVTDLNRSQFVPGSQKTPRSPLPPHAFTEHSALLLRRVLRAEMRPIGLSADQKDLKK